MELFFLILKIFFWIIVAIVVMALFLPQERIRELLQRFFLIVQGPADMLRQGSQTVLNKSWLTMQQAAKSVGINGEHWVQRLVGGIVLSIASLIGFFVGTLTLMFVIGGVFGTAADKVIDHLPLSPDALTAIELCIAAFIFGVLLLDSLDITHTTKFYSENNLNPWLKYLFRGIFVLLIIYSIYLFALSGIVRTESIFSLTEGQISVSQASSASNYEHVYFSNSHSQTSQKSTSEITSGNNSKVDNSANEEITISSETYKSAAKHLMIGIPIISITSGIFAGVALIVFISMLIVFPLFLTIGIISGIGWLIAVVVVRMIDLIYNLALAFVNFFTELGQPIRQRSTDQTIIFDNNNINATDPPPQNNYSNPTQMTDNSRNYFEIDQHLPPNAQTSSEQDFEDYLVVRPQNQQEHSEHNPYQSQPVQQDSLYLENDLNWNPLKK